MRKSINESKSARWTALGTVAIFLFCACFFTEIMTPLKPMLERELSWSSSDYGLFASAYGWLNIFFFMLIFGGLILDHKGIRFTGILSALIMLLGASIECWAISAIFPDGATVLGIKSQVVFASIGYAIYGAGAEINFITFSKIIVKWFKDKEMALAMGLQVSVVRIGIVLSMIVPIPLVKALNKISAPLFLSLVLLYISFIFYLFYIKMDIHFDREFNVQNINRHEEVFKLSDIGTILKNRNFWLLALISLLFYSGVFPFLKYSVDLIINKFNIQSDFAGIIPAVLPFGTLLLTPLFGHLYDKRGKGADMIVLGAILFTLVHICFALPFIRAWPIAVLLMLTLGVALSLVPSALWPTIPKIIPEKQLGTAYSLIFYMQNLGISVTSFFIGKILYKYCITGLSVDGSNTYNYTLPMLVFSMLGALAILTALILKAEERKANDGQESNINVNCEMKQK